MENPIAWGSSDVDWCEDNFVITKSVAEFYNTVSNVLFFIIPPVLMVLFRQYAKRVTPGVYLIWVLLIVVGLGSVYFHATLSLVGQLLDEVAILWVVTAAMALWCPREYIPYIKDRFQFQKVMLLSAVICTALGCVMPVVNAFGLLLFGIPVSLMLYLKVKSSDSERVFWLGVRCMVTWFISLSCWILDKFACSVWTWLQFPYLHCVWHLGVFLAAYQACILFAFFDAKSIVPEQMPVMKYWPQWSGDMGVPYIVFKVGGHKPTHKNY